MSVVIGYEEAGPWRKKLTIEVPEPAVEAETGRVVKELSRSLKLPGFRKGKVPPSLVLKRFSGEVERQVTERLVPRYWRQAEAEKNLDTLTQPQFAEVQFEPGTAMTFVALVETRPEIELKNVDDFASLPEGDVDPGEEEVAQALVDLSRQYASRRQVDRPAATGDVVLGQVFETAAAEAAESPPGGAPPQPLRIEIGAAGADEELSLALTGLKAGQSTTFRRRAGGAEPEREFRIEVAAVEEELLPEIDDAFAARVGDFADVAALREAVAERLRASKELELRRRREQALLSQLRERHPLELPNGVVDREVEEMLREQASRLSAQGIDLENAQIDWDSLAAQLRPGAQQRVHDRLLLDAIAKAKNVKLDEQEFERFLAGVAREQKKSSLAVRQELDAAGRLPALRAQFLERQTLRLLMGEGGADAAAADQPESSA